MRQAHMNNPYHAGFDGGDSRDPFGNGGGARQTKTVKQGTAPKNQDDALKMLTDMMGKRVQKRQ